MVNSLLTAIVRADGDALVMHVGEQPYVVAPSGPVELSSRPLTLEAVGGMLGQLLPLDSRRALDELGAVEHELPRTLAVSPDRFTVVAARGGDDIWIEIRRHRAAQAAEAPPAVPETASTPEPEPPREAEAEPEPEPVAQVPQEAAPEPAPPVEMPRPEVEERAVPTAETEVDLDEQVASEAEEDEAPALVAAESMARRAMTFAPVPPTVLPPPERAPRPEPVVATSLAPEPPAAAPAAAAIPARAPEPPPVASPPPVAPPTAPVRPAVSARSSIFAEPPSAPKADVAPPLRPARVERPQAVPQPEPAVLPSPALERFAAIRAARFTDPVPVPSFDAAMSEHQDQAPPETSQAVVLPLARNPVRPEPPTRPAPPARIAGLERLLRLASARGSSTLYVTSNGRPSIRVDGEIAALDGEPALTAPEVESLLLDLAPERNREALRNGEGTEWMSEVADVGRFRCQSFRDHRGPGGIFRLISARPTSVEQLGLSREIQSLCAESEGLVLVAGPRSSGKSTLVSALVDLVNRTRSDYVVTIESQIACAHESRGCLISQREVRGNEEEQAAAVRAALRENPDVLVIEDMRSPKVVLLALEAMESGHLVIGSVAAHTTATAVGRILDQCPPERREQVQLMLAEGLRGVVSQVLLKKAGGGRVAAREVLLNTSAIASLIAEGRISQLPLALDSGRKHGMVPLNDALAGFVQSGIVDVKDAYRKAFERQAFLAVLRREGVDTSFAERLA